MKHKCGVENTVVDVLGRQIMFLFMMIVQVTSFDRLKEEYESCPEFKETYIALRDGHLLIINGYYLQERYLFQDNKFCISQTLVHYFLIREIHVRGLLGYLGRNKAIKKMEHHFLGSILGEM
jgi:hypothetical protein